MIAATEASKPLHRWFKAASQYVVSQSLWALGLSAGDDAPLLIDEPTGDIVNAAQKLRLGGVQYRFKLTSIFRKIGSFFRISALGGVEAVGALFQRTQPESASDRTSISFPNCVGGRSERTSSSEPCESRTFAADRLRWMTNNPTERLPSSEPCDLELATVNVSNENAENNSRGRELSRELRDVELSALALSTNDAAIMSAEQFPGNGVTRRYRTLRAEGLTPKYANEFSRSSKKYVQFRILSTTRPRAGALTYWDLVKCFDHKAAARTGLMKQLAASKKEIAQFKTQIERARKLLIRKYVDGIDALKNDDVHLNKKRRRDHRCRGLIEMALSR